MVNPTFLPLSPTIQTALKLTLGTGKVLISELEQNPENLSHIYNFSLIVDKVSLDKLLIHCVCSGHSKVFPKTQ